jgi:enterochelin esterase-like enzyme
MTNNMKLIKSIILFLFTFSSLVCIAQSGMLTGDSYSKAYPTEKIRLKSSYVSDREYIVHITYAVDSLIPGKKYPVLYYTDAWASVDYFNLIGKALSNSKEIEPVILVGISFDADWDKWAKFILDGSHLSATPETWLKALTYLYAKKKESN